MSAFKYANNPQTTLSGAITAGATSINVVSGAAFPATGRFTIIVDAEIMLVTGVTGTTWTVERGSEATAAAAHNNNATVTGVLTRASLFSASGIDARSFGAVGDGVANDAPAIQKALDAASAAGGESVFISNGTFMLGATLSVPANTTLRGMGAASVLKLMAAVNAPAVSLVGSRAKVCDLKIDGNRAAQTGSLVSKGVTMDADNTTVDNCIITSIAAAGIDATDCSKLVITNNDLSDLAYIGIFVHTSAANMSDVLVAHNRIDRTAEGAGVLEGGLKVRGASGGGTTLSFARIIGNQVYMPTSPSTEPPICIELWGSVSRATVSDNITSGGYMGISLDSTLNGAVTGNSVYNFSSTGLELAFSDHCSLSGNVVDGNSLGAKGIVLSNASPVMNSVIGNTVRGCTLRAIQLNSGSNYTTISGNTINHTAAYAIELAASYYCAITGNVIYGGGTALKGIILDRSWDITVSGNKIVSFTENSILLFSGSADTFDWVTIIGNSCNNGVTTQFSGGAVLGANVTITHNPA